MNILSELNSHKNINVLTLSLENQVKKIIS